MTLQSNSLPIQAGPRRVQSDDPATLVEGTNCFWTRGLMEIPDLEQAYGGRQVGSLGKQKFVSEAKVSMASYVN